ncbi:MAG: LLM class F420-dependent oxidoreductase [Myxococcales bacterium]|nr:LLM class F420-dependent oxidoreductase [Myxococcales bacterium]MDD9968329.1 LLM class F420-dependent oxidoreductase [Myxococcales bacterium]
MKLGLVLGYSGRTLTLNMDFIKHAERLGFDSAWTAEAYGSDAISPAAWILAQTEKLKVGTAIMQLPARAPTMAAMTATSLNHLSGGRFIVGLGPSGPQVVEGWYGASYGRPLTRLREYIEIMRKVWEREGPLTYDGFHYQLPFVGEGSSGLGKPLKSILHTEGRIPIYTATLKPKALAVSAELADGFFPLWMNPERFDLFREPIEQGLGRAGKSLADFDVAPFVPVSLGDDLDQCRAPIKAQMALYIGGMGARGKNFYTTYAGQLGYEDEAARIQDLYLEGKKAEAMAAVPDALVDDVALVGPRDRIRERLSAWIEAGKQRHVGSMLLGTGQPEALELVASEVL